MTAPTIFPGRAFQNVDRVSDLLFSWRASDLSLKPVGSDTAGTFARASAGGLVQGTGIRHHLDPDNQLRLVGPAPDQLERWEWVQNASGVYVPALRLEGARTNGWTYSEQLNNGVWTKVRSSCSGAAIDATLAPDGETTADKLVEDGTAAASHRWERDTPALTDSTTQSVSMFVKAAERTEILIESIDKAALSQSTWFDLVTGTVGTKSASHTSTIVAVGNGWYRITVAWDSSSGGTTPSVRAYLGGGSESLAYNGDGASGMYLWGFQYEVDQPFASTYIPTVGSTVTRAAESLFWTYNAVPQPITVYCRFVEGGSISGNGRVFVIGGDATPFFVISASSSVYTLTYHNGSASVFSVLGGGPSIGDEVELTGTLTNGGAVQLFQSINGGTPTQSTQSGGLASASAWSFARLHAQTSAPTSYLSFSAIRDLKVAPGVRTMSYMRESF